MVKGGRSKTGLPLLPSNRYPAQEGSLIVCFSLYPSERWHSPTLEANFWQPLCSISISWQLTINRCDRKASLYAWNHFCNSWFKHWLLVPESQMLDAVQLLFLLKAPPSGPLDKSAPSHDKCQSSACHQVSHLSSLSHWTVRLEEVQTETDSLRGSLPNGHVHANF